MPKRLVVTGNGTPLRRVGAASIVRVLNAPVNVTGDGPNNYAFVCCETLGIYISRYGRQTPKAEFKLGSFAGHSETHKGVPGRDYVVAKFLRMLRKGKAYHREYPNQFGKVTPPPARRKRRS